MPVYSHSLKYLCPRLICIRGTVLVIAIVDKVSISPVDQLSYAHSLWGGHDIPVAQILTCRTTFDRANAKLAGFWRIWVSISGNAHGEHRLEALNVTGHGVEWRELTKREIFTRNSQHPHAENPRKGTILEHLPGCLEHQSFQMR